MSAFESDYKAMVDLDKRSTFELLKDTRALKDNEGEAFLLAKNGDETIGLAHLHWGPAVRYDVPRQKLYRKYGWRNVRRFIIGKRAFQMDLDKDECYIAHLAVSDEHRGEGVGTALINASKKFARKNGFSRLSLIVSEKNPDARRLYERKGFETTEIKFGIVEKIMFDDPLWRHMSMDVSDSSPSV